MSKRNVIILLIIIILAGGFLRIFPVRYDSVRMYDIQLVTEAFDLGDGIAKGDFSVFKMPVKYPYFFSYILLFFYGIFYLIGRLAGLFSSASEFINYIFFHLDSFYDFARILIGIFGIALIPLVYIVTSKVVALKNKKWARQAGLLAAFLMAFNLLHIHISHQERPHILVSFFIFLSFYFFILFLEKKSLIRSLLFGLSIGLAAGSLQSGLFVLIFFVLVVFFTKFKCLSSIKFWAGVLMFLIIFALCYPYLFLSFNQSTYSETRGFDVTFSGGRHGVKNFSGQGFREIIDCFLFYDPSLIFIFILFLLIYLTTSKNGFKPKGKLNHFPKVIFGGISFIVLYVCIFGIYSGTNFRKLTPLSPFLCFFVGILFSEIFDKFKKRFSSLRLVSLGLIFILILFLLFPMIQALRFNYLMFQKETRNLAKNWIENNIPNSDLIVMERDYIRFVPLKEDLQFQLSLEPEEMSRKDKFLLTLDDELYPKQSRSILRFWAFNEGRNNYQFLRKQGVRYFVVFKSTIKDISRSGLESEILFGGGELVKGFSPFINKDSLRYSDFPSEFKNPTIDLWTLKRLGPVIEIYRL